MVILTAKNIIYHYGYEQTQEISDHIILPSRILDLTSIKFNYDDSKSMLMRLENIHDNTKYTIVSIGTPHFEDINTAFIPSWILDIIGASDNDKVRIIHTYAEIPIATKITIRPFDSLLFDIDITECFSKILLNLHVLHQGATIPVRVPEFGEDYLSAAYIECITPAIISLTSTELEVEFINNIEEEAPAVGIYNPTIAAQLAASITSIEDTSEVKDTKEAKSMELKERRRRIAESWDKKHLG